MISVKYILDQEAQKEKNRDNQQPVTTVDEPVDIIPQQPETSGVKPQGWTDEQYQAVRNLYSNDEIVNALSQPDPNTLMNGLFSTIYKQSNAQPAAPDEKRMKRQRMYAGIGDALSLFSQAASGAMGAHNRVRTGEQTATAQLNKRQEQLYNRYLQEADRYSRGLMNAQMQDYRQGHQTWSQAREGIKRILEQQKKDKLAQDKMTADQEHRAAVLAETSKRNEAYAKNLAHQQKDREERTAITKQSAADSKRRTDAYITKLKSSGGNNSNSPKPEYRLVLPAVGNDPDAVKDELGNNVRVYDMTNGQMDMYAREAINNEEFMRKHPEFTLSFGQKYTADQKKDIAAAYAKQLYEEMFKELYIDARTYAGNQFYQTNEESGGDNYEEESNEDVLTNEELNELFQIIE